MHDDDRETLLAFKRFMERALQFMETGAAALTPFGERVRAHLGADPQALAVVAEPVAAHRLVDADLALEWLARDRGALVGVTGGQQRFHSELAELVASPHVRFDVGQVDYASVAAGPDERRRVVAFGAWLLEYEGQPAVVLQRAAAPQFGREQALLEVLTERADVASALLDRIRALMVERSVLRGQVLAFTPTSFGNDAGVTFVHRPQVAERDVVLPDGVMTQITDHVVGIGAHRDRLLAEGQHLKRGVLLYGPPGTGKTLTVRHLVSVTPASTVVLLTGASIRFVTAATELARTFQPSIVVLEDIDLVAMERMASPQPLLFEVLDALDGLAGDADVTFVMTTNRVEVLERALAERPGRVDLAIEVPKPDIAGRRELFARYAAGLPLSAEALEAAAERTDGVTGSFAKELVRRTVLRAAQRGDDVDDADLEAALEGLLSAREQLTRSMLGGGEHPDAGEHDVTVVEYTAGYDPGGR